MLEDTQDVIAPENETQDTATSTVEQQTTETSKEVAENELPDEASERTKSRFDELTRQLSEERQSRKALEDAFKTLKPKEVQQEETLKPIYDPDTGLLNEEVLTDYQRRTIEAEKRATQAEQAVQQYTEKQKQEYQEKEQEREALEAYEAHPDLNPTDKAFDQNLSSVTSSIMLRSMLHPEEFGDKQLSFKQAGDKAKELVGKIAAGAKAQGAQEAIEQLSPKEQAALEATGSSNRRSDNSNLEDLKRRTRRGDESAIIERLKGVKS